MSSAATMYPWTASLPFVLSCPVTWPYGVTFPVENYWGTRLRFLGDVLLEPGDILVSS